MACFTGMTLLETLDSGDTAKARAMLKAGADVNEIGAEGITPLMWAANVGDLVLVRELLSAGADPSLEDRIGETALIKAAAAGHREVFELLSTSASAERLEAAKAYLRASGKSHGPPAGEGPSALRSKLVEATANVAKFLGDEKPSERVERVKRAEKNRKP